MLLFCISQLVSDDCDPSKDLGGLGSCPLSRVVRRIDGEDVLLMMMEGQIFAVLLEIKARVELSRGS